MDKDRIKRAVMANAFALLATQGLLTEEEKNYLKVMLEGQSSQSRIYDEKSRHI